GTTIRSVTLNSASCRIAAASCTIVFSRSPPAMRSETTTIFALLRCAVSSRESVLLRCAALSCWAVPLICAPQVLLDAACTSRKNQCFLQCRDGLPDPILGLQWEIACGV